MGEKSVNKGPERLHETKLMNCGELAEIIEYKTHRDITVKFYNGAIVAHRRYRDFVKGQISPNKKTLQNHVGETRLMNCGMEATIMAWHGYDSIDVCFADGTLIQNKSYTSFKKGTIINPNQRLYLRKNRKSQRSIANTFAQERIGQQQTMNCGMKATIIQYYSSEDMSIRFEDGYIVNHVRYQTFKDGKVYNPSALGSRHISRNEFWLSTILSKAGFAKAESGELRKLGLGNMELDLYNPDCNGKKVGIEYDGGRIDNDAGHTLEKDLKKDKRCKAAGIDLIRIREPQLPALDSSSRCFTLCSSELLSKNLLETVNLLIDYLNNNYHLKISNVSHIDKEQVLQDFKQQFGGTHPYLNVYRKHMSEERMMNCGLRAKIVEWRNARDVDVQFEDGTIVQHKRYDAFKRGSIKNGIVKSDIKQDMINCKKIRLWNRVMPAFQDIQSQTGVDIEVLVNMTLLASIKEKDLKEKLSEAFQQSLDLMDNY